jgi:copper oxidase (laccase) domain-containing protein
MTTLPSVKDASLRYDPFSQRISVYLFGRPLDWSINPKGKDYPHVLQRIGQLAEELEIQQILAPRPALFNAEVCSTPDLSDFIRLGNGEQAPVLLRGKNADGAVIEAQQGFWVSSADCITIIVHDPKNGQTIAAHAGRDCLVDRARLNDEESREFESVVHAIAARYSKKALKRLRVFITCGIGPEQFIHNCSDPKWGPKNTRMILDIQEKWGQNGRVLQGSYLMGKICLSEMLRSQLISIGVPAHHIAFDGVDTYSDTDKNGEPKWWSHRRGDGMKRNGVLVVRNW